MQLRLGRWAAFVALIAGAGLVCHAASHKLRAQSEAALTVELVDHFRKSVDPTILVNLLGASIDQDDGKVTGKATKASLNSMEAAITQLAREHRNDPEMQELVKQIKDILHDQVKVRLYDQKDALQAQVNALETTFDRCEALLNMSDTSLLEQLPRLSNEHKGCRARESDAVVRSESCHTVLASLETVRSVKCSEFQRLHKIPQSTVCSAEGGENATVWYNRIIAELSAKRDTLARSEMECTEATHQREVKEAECQKLAQNATNRRALCNLDQDSLDQVACDAFMGDSRNCDQYQTCYMQENITYHTTVNSAKNQEAGMHLEYHAVLRMECLLDTFGLSASAQEAAIDVCRAKEYNTSAMNIVYPDLPALVPCSSATGNLEPGTEAYEAREYDPLPEKAPAKFCMASCCPLIPTTTTTTTHPSEAVYRVVEQCFRYRTMATPSDTNFEDSRTTEATPQDCHERCRSTAGCAWFTFYWDGGCHLADSGATFSLQAGAIDGPTDCQGKPTDCYTHNKKYVPDMPGMNRQIVDTLEKCQELCFNTEGCEHWTIWWDMGCHLQGADAELEYQPGAAVGPRLCPSP